MKIFAKNKTKLKQYWDESDESLSTKDKIEKYIDYSDTKWTYDINKSKFENILNLYLQLMSDPAHSSRVDFIINLLSNKERAKLQEIFNKLQEDRLIDVFYKRIYNERYGK